MRFSRFLHVCSKATAMRFRWRHQSMRPPRVSYQRGPALCWASADVKGRAARRLVAPSGCLPDTLLLICFPILDTCQVLHPLFDYTAFPDARSRSIRPTTFCTPFRCPTSYTAARCLRSSACSCRATSSASRSTGLWAWCSPRATRHGRCPCRRAQTGPTLTPRCRYEETLCGVGGWRGLGGGMLL